MSGRPRSTAPPAGSRNPLTTQLWEEFAAVDGVGRRVARHREGFHAGHEQPDFPARAFGVGVEMKILGPLDVADRLSGLGPRLRLAHIVKFGLVARTAAGAGEDLHERPLGSNPIGLLTPVTALRNERSFADGLANGSNHRKPPFSHCLGAAFLRLNRPQ
jgi:hypothetical protein